MKHHTLIAALLFAICHCTAVSNAKSFMAGQPPVAARQERYAEMIRAAQRVRSFLADRQITPSDLDPADAADRRELDAMIGECDELHLAIDRCLEVGAKAPPIDWDILSSTLGMDRSTLHSDLASCINVLAAATAAEQFDEPLQWHRVFWLSHVLLMEPPADALFLVHARLSGHAMRRLKEWACDPARTADDLGSVLEIMRGLRPPIDRVERMLAVESLSRERQIGERIGALPLGSPERERLSAIRGEVQSYYGALIALMQQEPRDRFEFMKGLENVLTVSDEATRLDPYIELNVRLLCARESLDTAYEAHMLLLAARVHQIRTGDWPESVDELWLDAWLPSDAASGMPLRLTVERGHAPSTVTVWAAGVDGRFDGVRSRNSRSAFSLWDGEGTDFAVTWCGGAAPGVAIEPCP